MAALTLDLNPPPRTLRQFGLVGVLVFLALAALAYFKHKLMFWTISDGTVRALLYVFGGLAVYCGSCAVAAPKALRPLHVLLSVAFFPVGVAVFHVVMAVVYFLVVTPMAVVFKIIRRDALHRKFDPSAASYWIPRRPPDDVKRYFRQF